MNPIDEEVQTGIGSPAGPRGVLLRNHVQYGRRHSPWASLLLIIFGAPFVVIGGVVIWGWFGVKPEHHVSQWIVTCCGLLFLIAGVIVECAAVISFFLGLVRRQRAARFADQPWLADYEWDSGGASDNARWKLCRSALELLGCALFLAPFNGALYEQSCKNAEIIGWIVIGFLDIVLLFLVGRLIYRGIQLLKYGSSRVLFERFPFFMGGRIDLQWITGRPIGSFRRIDMTLRCVEEHNVTVHTHDGKSTELCCYEVYSQQLPIEQAGVQESVTALPISFELPNEPLGTQITADVPRYWELEISADTPGVDYKATFLIPIYGRKS